MKNVFLIFLLSFCSYSFYGQTLVSYGKQTISREEFLTAFRKNNTHTKATEKAYREYLNLYIRYKLKVQAAKDQKLDTLPGQITELKNFKSQIVDQYITDEISLNQMAKEAFDRSQRDLRVSYIFVAAPKNASPADTAKAWQKIQDAFKALNSRKDFGEIALQFSEDPNVKENHGDLGYITVFDLPYAMETVAYNTAPGKISQVFRTNGGYIILKITARRPAYGLIKIAQILIIFPFDAKEAEKLDTRKRADSIYLALKNGADFGTMARKYSGDNLSYQLGGVLPEFGIGKYEAGFENTAFSLPKDGDISQPFQSAFGYHIIKRLSRNPIPAKADQKILDKMKEKIKSDPRVAISKKRMTQTILKQTQFKEYLPQGNRLWDYTDSALLNKPPASNAGLTDQSVLFQFPEKKYTVGDWITYRRNLRSSPNITNGKTNADILDLYRQTIAFDYYREHLEKYNAAFAAQVNEFSDGNLLFEVMQRQIWNHAIADSNGLKKYFDANTKKYWWKPGAEAIIFNAPNITVAKRLQDDLDKKITQWRVTVDGYAGQIHADSGRFELSQIPGKQPVAAGRFTQMVTNSDQTIQFAYIIRQYNAPTPRTYEEARGLVMNDYQTELENQWIDELRKKYPVTINETVFKTLPK
jgi:peptidyl-prolyl cis-trans isomerase SurA